MFRDHKSLLRLSVVATQVFCLGIFAIFAAKAGVTPRFSQSAEMDAIEKPRNFVDRTGMDPKRFAKCEDFPNEVMRLSCRVGAAATYMARQTAMSAEKSERSYYFEAFAALDAANIVQTVLSSPRYGYRGTVMNENRPLTVAESVENWAGICGHHVDLFLKVMTNLGIKARPIQFYYAIDGLRRSHIAAEVFYGDRWNYFDVTWNIAFPSPKPLQFKSHDEILADPQSQPQINALNSFYTMQLLTGGKPLEYLTARDVNVVVGYSGNVVVALNDKQTSSAGVENFRHLPNFIGDNQADKKNGGIKYELTTSAATEVTLHTDASSGCSAEQGDVIRIGEKAFDPKSKTIGAIIDGNSTLAIETKNDVCYVVLNRIEYRLH